MAITPIPRSTLLATLVVAALLLATPAAAAAPGILAPVAPPAGLAEALPFTRTEADGSTTLLGFIDDLPGAMTRFPVPEIALATGGRAEGGLFTRTWTAGGLSVTTIGAYVVENGVTRNVNLLVLEGVKDLDAFVWEFLRRDAAPIVINTLPFVANHAHPTSLVLALGLTLGIAVAVTVLATQGQTELASLLAETLFYTGFAPLFHLNILYPYHVDAREGEVYRDFPDVYVWRGIRRTPGGTLWDGAYLSRYGAYTERTETDASGNVHLVADAWKRDVVGPLYRLEATTTKLPGLYLRQDIHRDFTIHPNGNQTFHAVSHLTTGVYHAATGETPGAGARFEETKRGEQTLLYVPQQEDTIALGVKSGDAFTPLVGTRTEASHRPYVDVTNLGAEVGAIESYRLTSAGFFVGEAYVPVIGFDYWGERYPTDLWVLAFALTGLGDQDAGDVMLRSGTFVAGRFVPVVGSRLDDDFEGHRYPFRTMLSAGLVQANPLDPGAPVPGEAPDGAVYHPLVAATYDGMRPSLAWALANTGDMPEGMGPFLVSAGLHAGAIGPYLPLVGAEYVPGAHEGTRRAQETYRVGVFPGDYGTFIPLAGATYDGDHTSAAWAVAFAGALSSQSRGQGEWDSTQGVYLPGGYTPLTGVQYRPDGTGSHPGGHAFEAGSYLENGQFEPLVGVGVAFGPGLVQQPPAAPRTCAVRIEVWETLTGSRQALVPPCVS